MEVCQAFWLHITTDHINRISGFWLNIICSVPLKRLTWNYSFHQLTVICNWSDSYCFIKKHNTLLYPLIVICICLDMFVRVCKQNPSEQGAMAWNWREPTGRVSPWCSPPSPPSSPPGSGATVWQATQSNVSGEMSRAAVPSVSHKLGSGRSHGSLSRDEQREKGKKQLFCVFLLLLHQLTSDFTLCCLLWGCH